MKNKIQKLKVGTLYEKGIQVWVPEDSPFVTGLLCGKSGGEPRVDAHVAFLDGRPPCLRSLAEESTIYGIDHVIHDA